jgi:hypothetical protein
VTTVAGELLGELPTWGLVGSDGVVGVDAIPEFEEIIALVFGSTTCWPLVPGSAGVEVSTGAGLALVDGDGSTGVEDGVGVGVTGVGVEVGLGRTG